jgi:hypothetical protein
MGRDGLHNCIQDIFFGDVGGEVIVPLMCSVRMEG